MTPAEQQQRLDRAVALLKGTTVGWANHSTAWQNNQTTKWWQALDEISRVRNSLNPLPPPTPGNKYAGKVGASTHFVWTGVEAQARELKEKAGVTWIREDFHWHLAQPSKGGAFSWSHADKIVDGAVKAGLSGVLAIADAPPAWAWTDADYAAYCRALADRYDNSGLEFALEFWNEPYMPGPYLEPGRYARMCKAAGDAVKQAAPSVKRLANVDTGDYTTGKQDPDGYFDRMLAAVPNLASSLDAWALHPYCQPHGPYDAPASLGQRWRFDRVPYFQAYAKTKGASLPVWISEVGWATCTTESRCVTEAKQAVFYVEAVRRAVDDWGVERVFLYTGDKDGSADENESRYGMRRSDGSAKPVLVALKALTGG